MKKSIIFLMMLSITLAQLFSLQKGSNTVVSVEDAVTFPSADSDNQMFSFGFFKDGFSLEDVSTTCTFSSIFPVAGGVSLHGGMLCLDTDLIFQNVTNLNSTGYFFGNSHMLDFCESITSFPASHDTTLQDTKLFLNSDLNLTGIVTIKGDCTINGRKNRILFGSGGHIILRPGATLRFKNIELDGILQDSLWCADDSASLYLDNIRWTQDADYTFSCGSISFVNSVNFVGPYTFSYASGLTSTIESDSTWFLSDIVTLNIGRKNGFYDREPLYFSDSTSMIKIENSTLSITSSGMSLTRGALLGDGEVNFDINCTHTNGALQLGDGTSENDFILKLCPEAAFKLVNGDIVYNVVSTDNFLSDDINVCFVHEGLNTNFHVLQDIIFNNVYLKRDSTGIVTLYDDKKLIFDECNISYGTADYTISGTRLNANYDLLYQNDSLIMHRGEYPKNLYVYEDGNTIQGVGNIIYPVTLHNSDTELTVDLNGTLAGIVLNGGKAIFSNDINFSKDTFLTGSGTVQVEAHNISTFFHDEAITSTLRFESNQGTLLLNKDTLLTSQLIFSGDWEINGNGNILDLKYTGSILVDKNSSLRFSDVKILRLAENNIRCFDSSGTILFDDAELILDSDYSFTVGSFEVVTNFDISGTCTFSYESASTSTIDSLAKMLIGDGTTFSVGRTSIDTRDPLYFQDNSSIFELDNSTLCIPATSLHLTKGKVVINRDVMIDCLGTSTTQGLVVGDQTDNGNFSLQMNAASTLSFPRGYFTYKNTIPRFFEAKTDNARVIFGDDLNAYFQEDFALTNITVEPSLTTQISKADGVWVTYDNYTQKLDDKEVVFTGTMSSFTTHVLAGNGETVVKGGSLAQDTLVSGVGNRIYGMGGVTGPIQLQVSTAELEIGIAGLIETDITLGGGIVTLSKDLEFSNSYQFQGEGTVAGDNIAVFMGPQDLVITGTVTWSGTDKTINLGADTVLTSSMKISGNCLLCGSGKKLDIHGAGTILVEKDSVLTLRDMSIKGLQGNNIRCFDDSARIILDNTLLEMSDDYSFTTGSLSFLNRVDLRGTYTFSLVSGLTSTIHTESIVVIKDGSYFLFGKKDPYGREALHFDDTTSELKLDKSTVRIVPYGAHLTNGQFVINRDVTFDIISTATQFGFIVGDGENESSDFTLYMNPAAILSIPRGNVTYNCIDSEFFISKSRSAKIVYDHGLALNILQNLSFSYITADPTNLTGGVTLADGKMITFDHYSEEFPGVDFEVTGILYGGNLILLAGSHYVIIRSGNYPYATYVMGTGNSITGQGGISNPITFLNSAARLSLGVSGRMSGDITLNGGEITLTDDLTFNEGALFQGEGVIHGDQRIITMGSHDATWTGTLHWSGDGMVIHLRSDVTLTSSLIFSGDVTVYGHGNKLTLAGPGNILVSNDGELALKDIKVEGLSGNNLRCFDDSGKIFFDDVRLHMSDDYSFTTGSMNFLNLVDILGTSTFSLESGMTSTVNAASTISIQSGTTFAAGRKVLGGREPLYFADSTSEINLSNATLKVLAQGMNLTRGRLICEYDNVLDIISTSTEDGLILGDGSSEENDFRFSFNSVASLSMQRGHFVFNGTDSMFVESNIRDAQIIFGAQLYVYLMKTILLKNFTGDITNLVSFTMAPGATINYDHYVNFYADSGIKVMTTGELYNQTLGVTLLNGDDSIVISSASLPFQQMVSGLNNSIIGAGGIDAAVTLLDSDARLNLGVSGRVASDITLGGGIITLSKDLEFSNSYQFQGEGTVAGDNIAILMGPQDLVVTGTVTWSGTDKTINLGADTVLTSSMKISGNCLLCGSGKRLDIHGAGTILVEKDSVLTLRDMSIKGLQGNNIRCFDDSARIVLDNTLLEMSDDYSFTTGSLSFLNRVDLRGTYTFSLVSGLTSTIYSESIVVVKDGSYFLFGKKEPYGREALHFDDITSELKLDKSTVRIVPYGAHLENGQFVINRDVTFDIISTATQFGLIVGDGQNASADFNLYMNPAAILSLPRGHITYNCVDSEFFISKSRSAKIVYGSGTSLNLLKNLSFSYITADPTNLTGGVTLADGVMVMFDHYSEEFPGVDFEVSGILYGGNLILLAGNHYAIIRSGSYPYATYVMGTGNSITGQGGINNPITFLNSAARLSLGISGRMSSDINLNGGEITLSDDLTFNEGALFQGQGVIHGDQRIITMGSHDSTWTGTLHWSGDGMVIHLRSDVTLTSSLIFSGDVTVYGHGNKLTLAGPGNILVSNDGELIIKDVRIDGLAGTNIRCFDNSGKIVFDDTQLQMSDDYSFTTGSMNFLSTVDILGTSTFFYQSSLTSTIDALSILKINDKATFSIGRKVEGGREPLYFGDAMSQLRFDNSVFNVTQHGMRLLRGSILINRDVRFDIEGTTTVNGLLAGDGTLGNDFYFYTNAGSSLSIPDGMACYDGTAGLFFISKNETARLIWGSDLHLRFEKSFVLGDITGDHTLLQMMSTGDGAVLTFQHYVQKLSGIEFEITGTFGGPTTNILGGGDEIEMRSGSLPYITTIVGADNTIHGLGGVSEAINFQDSSSSLNLGIVNTMDNTITMSLGTLTLTNDLKFGDNYEIAGIGTLDLSSRSMKMGGGDLSITGTLYIDSSNGFIHLRNDAAMTSRWTFSGASTVVGNGNKLDLKQTGQILIERGSTLTFKNIILSGISEQCIRCLDDAGTIIFDNVYWVQDHNFSFQKGRFEVEKLLSMHEAYTFSYQSLQQSTIRHRAKLEINDDFRFSYAPPTSDRDLIMLLDDSSKVYLDGGTLHSTSTGLQLTKGELALRDNCYIESDATCRAEGIIFGDGISVENDLDLNLFRGAYLELKTGALQNLNINP